MALTEKMSLQEKIAELEGRIEKLEKAHGVVFTRTTITTGSSIFENEHWHKLWEEFEHVMKAAFGKE